MRFKRARVVSRLVAEMKSASGCCRRSASASGGATRSILLKTSSLVMLESESSAKSFSVVSMCLALAGSAASTTWSKRSASAVSSNVARNAANKILRQIADESHGVGDDHLALFGKSKAPRARVERGEELVFGEHVGIGERVEERALAGVGVAHDRDHRHVESAAPAATLLALLGQRLELRFEVRQALACPPATDFELRFTGAAPADTAGETRERVVFLPQPRERVLELGELDLQLAVARLCALREDIEDELGAIDDLEIGVLGDGRDLRRARGCDRR